MRPSLPEPRAARLMLGAVSVALALGVPGLAVAAEPVVSPTPAGTPTASPTPPPTPTPTPESLGTVELDPDAPAPPRRRPNATGRRQARVDTVGKARTKKDAREKKKTKKKKKKTAKKQAAAGEAAVTGADLLEGSAPIGVPNFFIEKFRIPPFLLPIYQAAGIQYGIRWELLAAINEIETDYGRNLNVSSAGAMGWMQFIPSSWKAYGVDANHDGTKDPYNPVDAIFAAARYLRAAGGETDVRKAVFAYNHANWYVDSVLKRARLIGGLPSGLVGSLTGLAQGRFPVYAKASYRGAVQGRRRGKDPAYVIRSSTSRRGVTIRSRRGAPAVAVNDGRIVRIGSSERLGRFVQLRDGYGTTFTYGRLGKIATRYPAPRPARASAARVARELELPEPDTRPTRPASAGRQGKARRRARRRPAAATAAPRKVRLFANPERQAATPRRVSGTTTFNPTGPERLRASETVARRLREGSRVAAGTILGRTGVERQVRFELRPSGRGAPRIDPKPFLDGWRLLETADGDRATASRASIGEILLMSKDQLAQRVLANPLVEVYGCGRRDIRAGLIDRRVLATLEFLAASGLSPTVTSLRCGRASRLTSSGNLSAHPYGNAVDIAAINGTPILGHQGQDSVTETTIRRLLELQGTLRPDQIISLMRFAGADNTLAMADHDDHIHVGWRTDPDSGPRSRDEGAALRPAQWSRLAARLGRIDNPKLKK